MAMDSKIESSQHWAYLREAGTLKGLLFLAWVQKTFGRKAFSVILGPVALYFFLFRPVARRASLDFLRTHYQFYPHAWLRRPGYWAVIKHFYVFGQSVLDKLLAWTIPMSEDEFSLTNRDVIEELMNDDSGQLIIGSHLGNLEYCRGFMTRYKDRPINALVYDKNSANFVEMMQRINPQSRMSIYQVDELDIPLILTLKTRIEAGEWLFIAGDRVPLSGNQNTVAVDFMGRQAELPIGPYMLAKTLQCKVKLMFSHRVKDKVQFTVVPFADQVRLPRKGKDEALVLLAQQFADALVEQCGNAPLQWFNFFPFWVDSPR